jgi:hypothetical protein
MRMNVRHSHSIVYIGQKRFDIPRFMVKERLRLLEFGFRKVPVVLMSEKLIYFELPHVQILIGYPNVVLE